MVSKTERQREGEGGVRSGEKGRREGREERAKGGERKRDRVSGKERGWRSNEWNQIYRTAWLLQSVNKRYWEGKRKIQACG